MSLETTGPSSPQTTSVEGTVRDIHMFTPFSPEKIQYEVDVPEIERKIPDVEIPFQTIKHMKEVSFLQVPELTSQKDEDLSKIIKQNRIELVSDPAAVCVRVKLKSPLDFKSVEHGSSAVAHFAHEEEAMNIIGDVAELLTIYNTANLLIEGHTATPPEKMDKWAHDLARSRAEMVKSTIASFGVDPRRLNIIALPGSLGSNAHIVVLKITGF